MWPYDLTLGPLAVNLYGIFTALGAALGLWALRFSAPCAGLGTGLARDLGFWLILWGLIGARAAYAAFNWAAFAGSPLRLLEFWSGGFMFQGGLLGGAGAACLALRRKKIPVLAAGDALGPALSLGQAAGRAGCLFAGCCYGRAAPQGFPFALVFPEGGGAPPGKPLYPVQAMEGLGLLVLSVWLFRLLRAGKAPRGLVFGAYLAGAGLLRLVMEAFRGDFRGQPFLGLAPTAWMALVTAAAGAVVIAAAVRRRKASPAGSGGDAGAGRGGGFGQADRFRPAGRDVLAQEGQEVRDFLAREEQASQEGREGLEGQEVREG